jgi:hypothetical protein
MRKGETLGAHSQDRSKTEIRYEQTVKRLIDSTFKRTDSYQRSQRPGIFFIITQLCTSNKRHHKESRQRGFRPETKHLFLISAFLCNPLNLRFGIGMHLTTQDFLPHVCQQDLHLNRLPAIPREKRHGVVLHAFHLLAFISSSWHCIPTSV